MLNKKIKTLLVFSILSYIFLVLLKYSGADLVADRTVIGNRFNAITLDFSTIASINTSPIINLFHTTGINPSGYDLGAVRIKGLSKVTSKYNISVVKLNGDDNFCSSLKLEIVGRDFKKKFQGYLLNLNLNSYISENSLEDIIFVVSLEDTNINLKNKFCEFNFILKTYRNSTNELGGIFAERKINNMISSGNW